MSCSDNKPIETQKSKNPLCCSTRQVKKIQPKSKPKSTGLERIVCPKMEKALKVAKDSEEAKCKRLEENGTPGERRAQLEQNVVPILMEGMLSLARVLPRDPVMHLEKFWLEQQQKCDIKLPNDQL